MKKERTKVGDIKINSQTGKPEICVGCLYWKDGYSPRWEDFETHLLHTRMGMFPGSDMVHTLEYFVDVLNANKPRNKQEIKIVSPVKNIPPDSIENTYGAPRPGGRVHEGIDLFADVGTPVYSVADGFILYIGRDNLGGNVIKLMGEDNRIYYYAHLSRFADYKNGDEVEANKNISR